MEWFPELELGLLNGWIYLVFLAITELILFARFPRDVVKRLFDRRGWSRKRKLLTLVGKLFALAAILLLVLTPIRLGSCAFYLGSLIALSGMLGFIKSLFDYRNTPVDTVVTTGMYRFSRHPQVLTASLVLLGGSIAVGSWSALSMLLAARVFAHQQLLAEEEACVRRYGDEYIAYQKRTPRYFPLP